MDKHAKFVVFNCNELDVETKIKLAEKIYSEAHRKIFDSPGFSEFYKTVINPPTVSTKLLVYYLNDRVVGYTSFHLYKIHCEQSPVYIAMSEIGLSVSVKKFSLSPFEFVVKELAKWAIKNPLAKKFMVDTLISPQVYSRVCEITYQMYPTLKRSISSPHQQLVDQVANYFNWETENNSGAIVRHLNWRVNSRYLALNNVRRNDNLQFYLKRVSDCQQGNGLVVVIPVTIKNMILTLGKIYNRHCSLFLHRMMSAVNSKMMVKFA